MLQRYYNYITIILRKTKIIEKNLKNVIIKTARIRNCVQTDKYIQMKGAFL